MVDFQLVQSNEVAGSTQMELERLKMRLQRLENAGLHVQTLVTYIHRMVKKFMSTEHHEKKHYLSGMWLNASQRNFRPMPRNRIVEISDSRQKVLLTTVTGLLPPVETTER